METLARKNEEEEERKKEKMSREGDQRRIPFEEQEDLRDVLMKKRGDKEKESGRGRPEKGRRSRSRSIKRERKSKSPRKKSRSKSWRKRSNSRSPVKRSLSRSARKRSRSRRRSLSRSRSRERSKDRSRGGRGRAERKSRSMSSTSTRRRSSSTKRSRSRPSSSRRRSRSRERGPSNIKEESRSPQKKGADRSNSRLRTEYFKKEIVASNSFEGAAALRGGWSRARRGTRVEAVLVAGGEPRFVGSHLFISYLCLVCYLELSGEKAPQPKAVEGAAQGGGAYPVTE